MNHDKLSKKQMKLLKLVFNGENEHTIDRLLQKHFKKQQCNGLLSRNNSLGFQFLENCYVESNPDSNVICSELIQQGKPETLYKIHRNYGYLPRKLTLGIDLFSLEENNQYEALEKWFQMCITSMELIKDEVTPPNTNQLVQLMHFISINIDWPKSIIFQHSILKTFRRYMRALLCKNIINDELLIVDYLLFVKEHCRSQEFEDELNTVLSFNPMLQHSTYFKGHKRFLTDNRELTLCSEPKSKTISLKIEEHNDDEQEHLNLKT